MAMLSQRARRRRNLATGCGRWNIRSTKNGGRLLKENTHYAYFTMFGDFDPQDISALLHLLPSESWKKGEINPRTHFERKFSRWSLRTRLDGSCALEDHVRDVIQQLNERLDETREALEKYEEYSSLSVTSTRTIQVLHLMET